MKNTDRKIGHKDNSTAALEREAQRRGISANAVMRQEREAHKRTNVRGKLYHAPIMDGAASVGGSEKKQYPVAKFRYCKGAVMYAQAADGTITVTLSGRIAKNLHKAAEAMNTVPWCDNDNTGVEVLANFVLWYTMNNWSEKPPHSALTGISDETGLICDAIETGADGDEKFDKQRKDELRAAFDKAFKFQSVADLLQEVHNAD